MNITVAALGIDGVDLATAKAGAFGGDPWDGAAVTDGTVTVNGDIPTPYGTNLKGLAIADGEWRRKMSFNAAWNSLRIGVLLRATVANDSRLIFGLTSGTTFGFLSNSCVNAGGIELGMSHNPKPSGTGYIGYFTKPTNNGIHFGLASNAWAFTRVGSIITEVDKTSVFDERNVVTDAGYWSCVFLHFTRNGDAIDLACGATEAGKLSRQFGLKALVGEAYRGNANAGAADGLTAATLDSFGTVALKSNGDLDTLSIAWQGDGVLQVGALSAARIW